MSSHDSVVWSEGMFLLPQHFQQQERHYRARLAQVLRAVQPHGWGFAALKIDVAQLALGTLALSACEGVMPDGSPFALTDEELARLRYPVADSERDVQLVLALAVNRPGAADTEAVPGTTAWPVTVSAKSWWPTPIPRRRAGLFAGQPSEPEAGARSGRGRLPCLLARGPGARAHGRRPGGP
ncbi:type VI secretion system baseplate subunit TssK [Pseudomonas sp. PCH446]